MIARSIIAALMAADRKGGLGAEAHETIRNAIAFLQVREAFGPNENEVRQDRLNDSAYAAGLKAGWNFAQEDDGDGLNRAIEQRVLGHRAAIEAARAEDKAREDAQTFVPTPEHYYPHQSPAPDALRVAVEEAAKAVVLAAWTDRFGRLHGHSSVIALDQALTALQAEQKGGAA